MPSYVKGSSGKWEEMYDFYVDLGSAWQRVTTAYVLEEDGQWHQFYNYVPYVLTNVSVSVSENTVNGAPNEGVQIYGNVVDNSGLSVPDNLPVELWNGDPTGSGTKLLTTSTSGGSYSFTWTPSAVGKYNLTVYFPLATGYMSSSASVSTITVNTQSSLSVSWPTYWIIGSNSPINGSVLTGTGHASGGTVTFYMSGVSRGTATVSSTGTFSIPFTPTSNDDGSHAVQIRYNGNGYYLSVWGSTTTRSVYQPTPGTPSQTVQSISNTSVVLKFPDQANVSYFISKCTETSNTVTVQSNGTAGATLTATWSISTDSTYHFTITAYSDNPTDGSTSGNTVTVTTGHAAVTDVGSASFYFNAVSTGSYRSADGWSNLGTKLGQGYYSDSSLGAYTGVATLNASAMQNTVDTYGADHAGRWEHISCSNIEIYMARVAGIGNTASTIPISFYLTNSTAGSGGAPSLTSGPFVGSPSGFVAGAAGWINMPNTVNTWAANLIAGNYKSVAIYDGGSANYSQYTGSSFQIRMDLNWSWTPVAYVAPKWSA